MNQVCTFTPRQGLQYPIIVAVTIPSETLDDSWSFYNEIQYCDARADGFYTVRRLNMPKKNPEDLTNSDYTQPDRSTLILEYKLLNQSEDRNREGSWIARRLAAIKAFLGFEPTGELPADHPGKIPNRRIP